MNEFLDKYGGETNRGDRDYDDSSEGLLCGGVGCNKRCR